MKKLISFSNIFVLLCSLLIFSCNEQDVESFPNTRSLQDVIDDFMALEFQEGINDIELEGSYSNTVWRFRLIVPAGASPANKRPLIVCLHGAATLVDPQAHTHTACLEEPGLANLDAYILCPNSEGWLWNGVPEQEKIINLTRLVKYNLYVNPYKVAIMGYSDGGNGAWYYAQYYPEDYTAAIPLASSYNPIRLDGVSVKIDIPMYVIHGDEDQLFSLSATQGYVDSAVDAGTDLTFVIAEGLEHYNSCAYVPYLTDAATWLDEVAWD